MPKLSRRQTLGLGLGAGLSVTMLTAATRKRRPPLANVTFSLLLVNDIYKMSDDKGRGGFAKLAAVVKAERRRGVPMLFCHAGDTFSPSLMSGFDQGAHIIELTNLIKPDVFVPGNHEFDFGKDVYLKRMGEANFPFFARQYAPGGRLADPGHEGRGNLRPRADQDRRLRPRAHGNARHVVARRHQVRLRDRRRSKAQAADLRKQGADLVVAVAHTDRDMDYAIVRSRLVDVLLSGHDHDLAIGYDGKTVMVGVERGRQFRHRDRFRRHRHGRGQGPQGGLGAELPCPRFDRRRADPEVLAVVKRYEDELSKELDVEIGTTEERARQPRRPRCAPRRPPSATSSPTPSGIRPAADMAITNGGGIRANKQYPAGTKLTRRDILSELPFGNSTSLVEMTGADIRAALENGVSQIENAPAASRRSPA